MSQPRRTEPAAAEPVNCWFRAFGMGEPAVRSVVDALAAVNVCLQPYDSGVPMPSLGLVAFNEPTESVCDFLRAANLRGERRILALSAASSAIIARRSWELLQAGASDVCVSTTTRNPLLHIAERLRRWQTVDALLGCRHVVDHLVGQSPAWLAVLRQAVEVARFTDATVLITGESGTGKERVAQLIHELDGRPRRKDLVVLDCSTVVPSLSGSEFFGHEKGAFTGAISAREGAFELADGGTLFLDEVGELPITLQAELLRVVQEGTFKRVGSNVWRRSSFRLVCATNRDLVQEQETGTFRSDFYFRIAGCRLQLPSLRERTEDIIPLFEHFFRQVHPDVAPTLEEPVRDLLLSRAYPGNVRDLRNLVHRICHRHVGDGLVTVGDIPDEERPAPGHRVRSWRDESLDGCLRRGLDQGATLKDIVAAASERAIAIALDAEGGNLQRAARALGVTDRALQLRQQASRRTPSRIDPCPAALNPRGPETVPTAPVPVG